MLRLTTTLQTLAREWLEMPRAYQVWSLFMLAGAIGCVALHVHCDGFRIWHLVTGPGCQ